MSERSKIKKAYKEIEKVCEKHIDIAKSINMDDIKTMLSSAKNHLLIIEWEEKYGISLPHSKRLYRTDYVRIDGCLSFSYYNDGEKNQENGSGKYISWSDDERQPKNEWLLCISFPTGAYVFGQDYEGQQKLFQDFFNELKSYGPKYTDTANKTLYWNIENAKKIYNEVGSVFAKYKERNKSEFKAREIQRLRKEMEKLAAE